MKNLSVSNVLPAVCSDTVFDRAQIEQMLICERHFKHDSIIRHHPEWSPSFMNFAWNKEKNGHADHVFLIANCMAYMGGYYTIILGLALRILGAPRRIMDVFWKELVSLADDRCKRDEELAKKHGWKNECTDYRKALRACRKHFFEKGVDEDKLLLIYGLDDGRVPSVCWDNV